MSCPAGKAGHVDVLLDRADRNRETEFLSTRVEATVIAAHFVMVMRSDPLSVMTSPCYDSGNTHHLRW